MDKNIKTILSDSYNANAKLRDKPNISEWKQAELDFFLSRLEQRKDLKIVDVGAGTGQQGQYLKEHGHEVTCIDLSSEMVQRCKARGLDAYEMDFYAIDFPPASFDAAWSMNTLLHVPKSSFRKVFLNIKNVLKQDGLFYFGMYGGKDFEGIWEEDIYEPNRFFSFYEHEAIKEKAGDLFEIVDLTAH